MTKIKFGTDGWRAIIAKDYTVDNVKRVAEGTALWMTKNGYTKVVIGHDCRLEDRCLPKLLHRFLVHMV